MNKRIEELMQQAMVPNGVEGIGGSYKEFDEYEFAKLLLEECARIATEQKTTFESAAYDIGHNDAATYISNKILSLLN